MQLNGQHKKKPAIYSCMQIKEKNKKEEKGEEKQRDRLGYVP